MVGETRAASEISVKFDEVIANMRERARRARHAVTTHLIAGVRDVTCTRFVARFTDAPSSRGSNKFSDHVTMSFDIIVQ